LKEVENEDLSFLKKKKKRKLKEVENEDFRGNCSKGPSISMQKK
jgi:hypothetical protein